MNENELDYAKMVARVPQVHVFNIEKTFGKSTDADYATTIGWIGVNDHSTNTIITRRISPNNKNTNYFHVLFNDPRFLHQTLAALSTTHISQKVLTKVCFKTIKTPN